MDGVEIEIVGGFVQQQRLRIAEECLRQQYPELLAALQLAHFALMHLVRNIEALQQDRGIALGGIPVFLSDDAFEFAKTHAVGIVQFRLFVDVVALLKSGPQALVAHDDGIDDAIGVESILVLAQHAKLSGANDNALLGVEIRAQNFHERGLARSVWPGQAVAATGSKGGGDIFEKDLRSITHAYIADRNHN